MANLAWGKPKIRITKLGGTETPIDIPTPVEGSTRLTTTKGATRKLHLKVEGLKTRHIIETPMCSSLKFMLQKVVKTCRRR